METEQLRQALNYFKTNVEWKKIQDQERLCNNAKWCCRKRSCCPVMIYLSIIEDFIIVISAFGAFFYTYFGIDNYLDGDDAIVVKRYLLKTYSTTLPIVLMLIVKLVYGLTWGCVKGRRTRNNFIAYYRIGITTNLSLFFFATTIAVINYEYWIMMTLQLCQIFYGFI